MRADRPVLVVALDDRRVDRVRRQRLGASAALNQQFQFVRGVEALHLARRIALVVPHPVLVAVGVEDHRALAVSVSRQSA